MLTLQKWRSHHFFFRFLDLAKRFSTAPAVFSDHRFIVLTTDLSSNAVNDFIEAEDYPADIVAIDEDDFPDLGFEINLDELHVYLVDQCGKLSFIVVPPWRYVALNYPL